MLHIVKNKYINQITAASAQKEVKFLNIFALEEFEHRILLIRQAPKVLREAASGEPRRNLGPAQAPKAALSAADTGDPGTCEAMEVW